MKRILVIDDDAGARASLRTLFETDYHVTCAASAEEGLQALEQEAVDLVLLDVVMPQKDGLTLLGELGQLYPDLPVIMVSATDRAKPLVDSMQLGAVDFVTKPFDVRELRSLVIRTLEQQQLKQRSRALEREVRRQYPSGACVGESANFQEAVRVAKWASRSGVRVLLEGPVGSGKELLARQIHLWSDRASEPFVVARCRGTEEQKVEAHLFGVEPSQEADPGAGLGAIELAGNGTVYLEEVEALSPPLQEKLEQLLQTGRYTRQDSARPLQTAVRFMAGSRTSLKTCVERGAFRPELFNLLNVSPISLDPLQQRREDIPVLISHFLEQFRSQMDTAAVEVDDAANVALINYDWPGNIQELRLVLERVVLLHPDQQTIGKRDLPGEFQSSLRAQPAVRAQKKSQDPARTPGLSDSIQTVERELLMQALRDNKGVQTKAAKQLGITRRILKYKMDKLNITLPLPEE